MDTLKTNAESGFHRAVMFAVELIDAVDGATVSDGIKVRAREEEREIERTPIVNRSGCFVWLQEQGGVWPTTIKVSVGRRPYQPVSAPALDPNTIDPAKPETRRQRIFLCPTQAYDFPPGVTALRGRVFDGTDASAHAVDGATVQLRWKGRDEAWTAASHPATTDRDGAFAVFLRMPPSDSFDAEAALRLPIRLRVTVGDEVLETGDSFPFSDPERPGCVREGEMHAPPVRLNLWTLRT